MKDYEKENNVIKLKKEMREKEKKMMWMKKESR